MIAPRPLRSLAVAFLGTLLPLAPRAARAQSAAAPVSSGVDRAARGADAPSGVDRAARSADAPSHADRTDAESHFHHGVLLFKDNDYAGSLVEFRRAYELAPNYRVLYNIGQACYQLQRYADALRAFEAYLAQGGAQIPAARRSSLEGDLRLVRARVGRVEVGVNIDDAEIRVDDEVVGTSPARGPLLVSVGHRKITVAREGRVPLERFIDVASGDELKLSFEFREEAPPPAAVAPPAAPAAPPLAVRIIEDTTPAPPDAEPARSPSHAGAWVAWVATGLLAAGAATTGVLTLEFKRDLSRQLGTYPGDPNAIERDRNRTRTFGTVTDVLLGTTAVSACIALFVTVPLYRGRADRAGANVEFGVGLRGLELRGGY